jgi:hypothetical protein
MTYLVMTKQELDERIKAIEHDADNAKHLAYRQYVAENAKYKIGDIVTDGMDTIRVEQVSFTVYLEISIFYYGVALTKKGVPRKDGERRAVYESRIKNK